MRNGKYNPPLFLTLTLTLRLDFNIFFFIPISPKSNEYEIINGVGTQISKTFLQIKITKIHGLTHISGINLKKTFNFSFLFLMYSVEIILEFLTKSKTIQFWAFNILNNGQNRFFIYR